MSPLIGRKQQPIEATRLQVDAPGPERPPDRRTDGIPVDDREHEGDREIDRVHVEDVLDLTHVEDVPDLTHVEDVLGLIHAGENGIGDHQNNTTSTTTMIMTITTTKRGMKRTTTDTEIDLALPVSSQVCQKMRTNQVPPSPAATRRIRKKQKTHHRKESDLQHQLRKQKQKERDSVRSQKKRRESGHLNPKMPNTSTRP